MSPESWLQRFPQHDFAFLWQHFYRSSVCGRLRGGDLPGLIVHVACEKGRLPLPFAP